MKVMSAIQARLHDAMRKEFILIAGIVRDYAEDEYEYKADDKEAIKSDDFDGRVDVIPVSDPNAATMSQRIMQYQAALQLSQSAPQMYDLPELHRQMLDVLGIQDPEKIIPLSEEMKPRDPVSENMDVLNSKPLKAFIRQDHEAHIQVHMAAIQDPKIQQLVSKSPMAGTIAAAMAAHVQEHLGFQYRREIEKQLGLELPPPNEPLPEDIEVKLSRLVAEAAERLFNKNVAEAQQQQAQQQAQDPMFQLQQQELELRRADIQRKAETDKARLMLNAEKERSSQELERDKMAQDAELEGVKLGVEIAKAQEDTALRVSGAEEKAILDRARLSTEVAKALLDDDVKRTGKR
jgi:hypothetical protein